MLLERRTPAVRAGVNRQLAPVEAMIRALEMNLKTSLMLVLMMILNELVLKRRRFLFARSQGEKGGKRARDTHGIARHTHSGNVSSARAARLLIRLATTANIPFFTFLHLQAVKCKGEGDHRAIKRISTPLSASTSNHNLIPSRLLPSLQHLFRLPLLVALEGHRPRFLQGKYYSIPVQLRFLT